MPWGFGSLGSIQIKRKGEGGKEQNMNICGLKLQYFIRGLLNISQDSHSLFTGNWKSLPSRWGDGCFCMTSLNSICPMSMDKMVVKKNVWRKKSDKRPMTATRQNSWKQSISPYNLNLDKMISSLKKKTYLRLQKTHTIGSLKTGWLSEAIIT